MIAVIPILRDADERMRPARGFNRVDRDLQVALSAVLEPDRHRKPARHLAMGLRFGGARADRRPRDQVGDVLRRDRIEHLGPGRQTERVDVEQQAARTQEPLAHVARVVHVRVVDHAFPSDCGARLLEVHAHHDEQPLLKLRAQARQALRIFQRGGRVVNRARPHDAHQARVLAADDAAHGLAGLDHGARDALVDRKLRLEQARRDQGFGGDDVQVLNFLHRTTVYLYRKGGLIIKALWREDDAAEGEGGAYRRRDRATRALAGHQRSHATPQA
jgi:cobaltochelatase CobN